MMDAGIDRLVDLKNDLGDTLFLEGFNHEEDLLSLNLKIFYFVNYPMFLA
jgi:hypothetical protein